jgi:hypothetical protein
MRFAFAFRLSALAGGFAALAALVATGATNGLDRWAIDHTMPGAHFGTSKPTTGEALIPLLHVRWHGTVHVLAEIVTLPAAFLPSLLLLVALRRFAWIVPWAAGTAVEGICKLTLTRPALYHHGLHLAAFDNSYPSGHTIRAIILAAAWPAARPWAVVAIVLLELGGFHVPTDIAGGLLLAALLLGLRLRLLGLRR